MAEGETTLEYTPTWVVAAVCSVVVLISLAVERVLYYTDKYLKKTTQKPVFEALQKIKQELLLGLIALLLTTFQDRLGKICITEKQASQWLPCKKKDMSTSSAAPHYCSDWKVPLLSAIAWHHLHIFIFALAAVHATFCVLTILFAKAKMSQWKRWEDSIKRDYHPEEVLKKKVIPIHDRVFIRSCFLGFGRNSDFIGWLFAFFKQFYGSVSKADYLTMRHGFVQLLLAVGTKLEHVITQLVYEVAEKHIAIEGALVVQPSDDQFWFHRPRLILFLIHIILFQNSFQLAYFFWLWSIHSVRLQLQYLPAVRNRHKDGKFIQEGHI